MIVVAKLRRCDGSFAAISAANLRLNEEFMYEVMKDPKDKKVNIIRARVRDVDDPLILLTCDYVFFSC